MSEKEHLNTSEFYTHLLKCKRTVFNSVGVRTGPRFIKLIFKFKNQLKIKMTTIDFTERIALFFSRVVALESPQLLGRVEKLKAKTPQELQEIYDDRDDCELLSFQRSFKGFRILFVVEFGREECVDDEDCPHYEGGHPIIPSSLKPYYNLSYGGEESFDGVSFDGDTRHYVKEGKDDKDYIYSLVKQYTLCKGCEAGLAQKDGWCRNCYAYVCTQKDDCCICKENEGVWVELSCKHILHKACWKKTVGLNCPLCREEQRGKYAYETL